MIRIDMKMPDNCLECPFCDRIQAGCNAAEEPGFCVFVGLSEIESVEWEDWKKKASSGRDPRCPLRQECQACSTVFDVAYKAGKDDSIVRCKDCKHRPIKPKPNDYESGFDLEFPDDKCPCQCVDDGWYSWYPADNWFCAEGERK